jgi:trk system potassium uptake protein TrkH
MFFKTYSSLYLNDTLRYSMVELNSLTTTGFSSANYAAWGTYPVCLLLVYSMIGGCTGSTAGAIKIFRFQILFQAIKVQIRQLVHPHGVFRVHFNEKPVAEGVIQAVLAFFFVYITIFFMCVLLLSFLGLDVLTSASAVASSMAAAGYGLSDLIGPAGSYKPLPDLAKWVLSAAMIMGRLEFFTLLVLFSPRFWRS